MLFLFLSVFCFWLSLSLIKEFYLLSFISLKLRRLIEMILIFYFLGILFWLKLFYFLILPCFLLLGTLVFLKYEKEKNLFYQLYDLLLPLESAMKSGMSFLNAWEKAVSKSCSKAQKNKLEELTEVLKFQNRFLYPENKNIERFMTELLSIKESPQPLKRIYHLRRKLRIEMIFKTKANRALLQIRAQSFILCIFYAGLLINTLIVYKQKNLSLILTSLIFFIIGLIWIFTSGRNIKWSI